MKKFIKGILSEESGMPSWKRVAGAVLLMLFVVVSIANVFYGKDLETTLKNQLYYLLTTFVTAIVIEKVGMAIAEKNKKDSASDANDTK